MSPIQLGVEEHNDPEELVEAISLIVPEKEEEIMTAAQKLWSRGMREGEQKGELLGRRRGRQQGRREGRQEGRQLGLQEGLQQGMQQGLQASKLGIARKMLQDNLPGGQISKWTGLDLAQIDEIRGGL
ncbi:MAG: hypothetical protein AAFV97_04000 [Bacteroidota bacterium]